MPAYPLEVKFDGHTYRGQYTLRQGGIVCVSVFGFGHEECVSAAGEPLGPVVERLALKILADWHQQYAADMAEIQANTKRLSRRRRPRLSEEERKELMGLLPPVTSGR